ncbi:MAG: glycosyltransferase family 39 protein [Actinomycetota bacterium]
MTASNHTAITAHHPAGAQRARATSTTIALAPLAAIVILGAALRISQLHQSLFADELWSYVGATRSSFDQVIDYVRTDQEITPPLYTVLAWLSAKAGDPTVMIRLPSLLGGIVTIPLTYALGLRTLGSRGAACLGAALVALSPFLLWYSVEARAYGLTIALVVASTLSLLIAIDRGRWRWWAAYAGLSCAAMYAHYTAVFVLLAQLAWALWFHPEVRRQAIAANLAAASAFLPWLSGLVDDLESPSQHIYGTLAQFNLDSFTNSTVRFAFSQPLGPKFSSTWPKVALVCGFAVAIAGAFLSWRAAAQRDPRSRRRVESLSLVVMLALAAPVGVAAWSLIGNDLYLPRNLVTSWPGLAVGMAALLTAGPLIPRTVAIVLVVGAFAYGAIRTTGPNLQRPGFREAAAFIDEKARAPDLVLDINPLFLRRTHKGPPQPPALTLDINFEEAHNAIDYLNRADGRRALRAAAGRRLVLAGNPVFVLPVRDTLGLRDVTPVAQRSYQGILPMTVEVFAIPPVPPGSAQP